MADVAETQRALNTFTDKYLKGLTHVMVDGKKGRLTTRRIREVKYFLGYAGGVAQQNAVVDQAFLERIWHPGDARYSTPERVTRGAVRRKKERDDWEANHQAAKRYGVGTFDGHPCANAAIPILKWCRAHGWHGYLVSGWRDPAYSEALCYRMCGHPTCPGTCAGKSSNHVGSTPTHFAVDVSDYVTFRRVVAGCPLSPKIHNALPRDPVHFSPSGN